MSKTQCVYPQVGCLVAAEEMLGEGRIWRPSNIEQRNFLKESFNLCKDEVKGMSELENIASWEVAVINKFLKDKGFNIQLKDFQPGEFGTASVLDVLVKWLVEGEHIKEKTSKGKTFDAAKLSETTVEFYKAEGHSDPIAKLLTQDNEYSVYMTSLDSEPNQLDLISIVSGLKRSLKPNYSYSGLVFPCVDLDQKVNIDWLLGMETTDKAGNLSYISQALQQTKLRMNEKGARGESGVAIGVTIESAPMPKPDYIINKPFLTWFEKPNLNNPLLAGYITEEDWKRPASIED